MFLHTRKGVLLTKLIPVHLLRRTFLMNRANGMATSFSKFNKTVIGNDPGEEMTHVLVYLLLIEMLQASVTRVMKSIMMSMIPAFNMVGAR